ncbi:hypothetical protein [Clostridium sp. HBUAS56017]|uniref:hypothetical protein n=1 Tax=Clostridium sp. HBUAS56017 TaxID=2571128 RepID=UPI00117812D7|nr:hypothetical protein [Clostridium sp. HBUAS56017]
MKEKPIKTKDKAFEYLNKNKEKILDMRFSEITLCMMRDLKKSYETCRVYYYMGKEEVLGCPSKKKEKLKIDRPMLVRHKDILVGENGEYSLENGGLLLTNGKAYLNFGNKEEFLKFFNEAYTAYEKLEEMEC